MQVLVYHDLLGMLQHPHHAKVISNYCLPELKYSHTTSLALSLSLLFCITLRKRIAPHIQVTPKFCKQYAQVGDVINKALLDYKEEVTNRSFPGPAHSPYKISAADVDGFLNELQKMGLDKAASAAAAANEQIEKAQSHGEASTASD